MDLVQNYIKLLDDEYTVISELLNYIELLPDQGPMENAIRETYLEKLEQIKQVQNRNYQFLRTLEYDADVYNCMSAGLDTLIVKDDDASTVVDAESVAYGISTSISEASIEVPLSDQEKSSLRRKQLADALGKGEPVTVPMDGQISDISTSDAIAALCKQLADGVKLAVNSDGTIMSPSDCEQVNDGGVPVEKGIFFGGGDPAPNDIQLPNGKLAGGYGMCRICGTVFNQITNYCPECGTKVVIEKPAVTLDEVQFSAIAPKTFVKGDYSVIEILMYEEAFRHVVQETIVNADDPVKETKSGILTAEREAKITVMISSPDFEIDDNTESQIWQGGYLNFSFAVEVPEQYKKKHILFVASVYINGIIATRLKFVAKCTSIIEQKIEVNREDVLSAFVSYASQDRNRVAMIIQGMKKARPDMDIFFDVDSLRSGDDWEKALWREIDKRDVLFLCWSKYARNSKWVDAEWRYAFKNKGPDSIEPVPIDPPGSCPPPDELSRKHFNDKLLYIINSSVESQIIGNERMSNIENLAERLETIF